MLAIHRPTEAPLDLLASLSAFVRVADTGSFSAVARETAASQSAVTRQIAQLEEHFGVRLFHRTTRRLSLTEDGEVLLERARPLVADALAIEDHLRGHAQGPTGVVRLGISVSGALFLAPRLPMLLERHPGLSIELEVSDEPGDLIGHRIDIALRGGEIGDTAAIARRIGAISRVVVAAPAYLARAGCPERPDDLSGHACIGNGSAARPMTWRFTGPEGPLQVRVSGPVSVNDTEVACRMALAGHGIALLPGFHVVDHIREGRLTRILKAWPTPTLPIHLLYSSRRNLPVRTRMVMDFLAEEVKHAMMLLEDQV